MSFREKQKTPGILKAESRLNGMQLIDKNHSAIINYGSDDKVLTVAQLQERLNTAETTRSEYNKILKTADELSNAYEALEAEINDMSRKILAGALAKFGADSDEYEQVGGIRTSDRKKPVRKTKVTA
jgi:hypothetical protein